MSNEKKRSIKERKKELEEMAIQKQDHIKEYEAALSESKHIVELKEQEYQYKLQDLKNHVVEDRERVQNHKAKRHEYKKDIILRLGKMIERYALVPTYKISAKLKRDLKGYIGRGNIYEYALDQWRDERYNQNPLGRNRSDSSKSSTQIGSNEAKPLTEYEKQYVEVYEEKVERNEHIVALIDSFLGMNAEQQAAIAGQTPKGTDYRRILIDKAQSNILRIIKALNDPDIPALLGDIRFLKQIITKVADIAYDEQQTRKRNKALSSK